MDYDNISDEDLKRIVKDGMKSPFWGWLERGLKKTKERAELELTRRSINTLDDCISVAKWNAIWKSTDEMMNMPNNVLKTFEIQKNSSNSIDDKQGRQYGRPGSKRR